MAYLAAAWLLVQILETVFPIFGMDETGIRWVVVSLVVGFVPAVALSWAFQWSPGALRAQSEFDADPTLPQGGSARAADRVVIGLLALGLLWLGLDRFVLTPGSSPAGNSIAVLPFADMTAAQDQRFFGDGLAEELLNLLAGNTALRVAARTSSFSFRDAAIPIGEIAERLDVTHLLEGSVRRDGERIRITAQLIAANDGFHVWSQVYEEPLSDIFSVQDRIAAQIAAALESSILGGGIVSRRTDPDTYTLYLQAKYQTRIGSRESMERAVALLQEALTIDPGYAPAWAHLAHVYSNLGGQGHWEWDAGFAAARNAPERAVAADPVYPEGHLQLAWISHRYDGDLARAVEHAQRGFELGPVGVDSLRSAAVLLLQIGKLEKAISLLEYCTVRSPIDSTGFYNPGVAYKYADRLAAAERTFRTVLRMNPEYNGATYQLGETLLLGGRAEEALDAWRQLQGYNLAKGTALAMHALQRAEESDAALAELIETGGDEWPSTVVDVYAYRGEIDAAFDWLQKDFEKFGSAGWGEMRLQRLFDNLRNDPRWAEFLEKTGVSDSQLAALDFEVRLPD